MVVQAAGIAMIDSYRGMRKVVFGGQRPLQNLRICYRA